MPNIPPTPPHERLTMFDLLTIKGVPMSYKYELLERFLQQSWQTLPLT